jgi:hypothetical protein
VRTRARLNQDPKELFKHELLPDEDIVWYGQPDASIVFCRGDLVVIPLSLLWAVFAISVFTATLNAAISGSFGGLISLLISGPLVVVGVYLTVGRFFWKRWLKRRTHYAVTTRRVVGLVAGSHRSVEEASLKHIPAVAKDIREDGRGTIWFGGVPWWVVFLGSCTMDTFWPTTGATVVFYDIADAESVYVLANELRAK